MNFDFSDKVKKLQQEVKEFMEEYVYPKEKTYYEQVDTAEDRWTIPPIIEELKEKAKARGLWNLFLPDSEYGA